MSASPISRFFAPVRALVGLGLLVAAGGWAALLWSRVHGGEAISIMSLLLAGALALGALAAFASAFPTGCRQCRKRFVETGAAFPSSQYQPLLEAIHQRKGSALRALADAPGSSSEAKTVLAVHHCPTCRRVGEAVVSEERWQGQFFETTRKELVVLDPETLAALLAMIDQRAAAFAAVSA